MAYRTIDSVSKKIRQEKEKTISHAFSDVKSSGGGVKGFAFKPRIKKQHLQKLASVYLMLLMVFQSLAGVFMYVPKGNEVKAADYTYDFSNSSDYNFDNTKVEFSSGQAQLKTESSPAWYNTSWKHRKKITINHTKVAGDLTDFPVLVSRTDPDWKGVSNGGYVGKSNGGDFAFTLSDGVTSLDYEIEKYDNTTGELVAWVKIPSLSSASDADIYAYYGNSAAADQWNVNRVWNDNFKMVQHVNVTGVMNDSTSNSHNGSFLVDSFMNTSISEDVNSHQGVARNEEYFYAFDTSRIDKYDSNWILQVTNTHPTTDIGGSANHMGDGDFYNNNLYVPVEAYSNCSSFSNQYIGIWDASKSDTPAIGGGLISWVASKAICPTYHSCWLIKVLS